MKTALAAMVGGALSGALLSFAALLWTPECVRDFAMSHQHGVHRVNNLDEKERQLL